ncbi:MAG: hypothetical protein CSB34_01820 [Desulfobulbus propionicus]|nr:MAG: hypothetical protein CSB34_01820 [Desulfobulbus propionicus]
MRHSFFALIRFTCTLLLIFFVAGSRLTHAAVKEPTVHELVIVFEEPAPPEGVTTEIEAPQEQQERPLPAREKQLPQVAIIIDDMGYHDQLGKKLLGLDMNLSYSFLPHAPFTREHAQIAKDMGRDILVHIPMEPKDPKWNPGRQALYVQDSQEQIREKTRQLISLVPHATGANNHMGSRFSEESKAMEIVLEELKRNNFFYIDSFTTVNSQGLEVAGKLGIPTNRRHVFLDNVHDPEKVCAQILKLVKLAREKGSAIGIAHPSSATLDGLLQCENNPLASVTIVGVHHLVQ